MVARVSLASYYGEKLLDTFVRPTHTIFDYRASTTNLTPANLYNAPSFQEVQQEVAAIIRNKVVVGHKLWMFLSIMGLSHPALRTRDLALFLPLRRKLKSRRVVELEILVRVYMGRNLGIVFEDPLENARASMDLFRSCQDLFEGLVAEGCWPCNLPPSQFAQYFT
ncbi:rna exonuclease 4 [Moniliophthora roreri MCA 2997]|nr:rna exonuclease 4 [Moniliophthora roreri MCA 2997]